MSASQSIDLNCDLGEGGANDASIMPLISSSNIACGGHAGDEMTMRETIRLALKHGVAIGAHPGYEDRESMGRRSTNLSPVTITELVTRQLELIAKIAKEFGTDIHHVKLHGALYHQADADPKIASAVARAIQATLPQAMIYALPHACMQSAARDLGLGFRAEGFVDRRYCDDGSLVPRDQAGAVMDDPTDAVAQVMEILSNGRVTSIGGVMIPIKIDTLCVHSDNESALEILRSVREALNAAGVRVCH
ncbi:MAG: hypothetical protein RLY69_1268 [Verrucomicrobiota bacterium]